MPLTARHRNNWTVDSTNDEHWAEVHVPDYRDLLCPECQGEMRARKETGRTRRHFYHLRTPEWCSFSEESPQHLHTKAMVAAAVREVNGWTAEIEFTGDGWRADVLASSPSGHRRIAWEPQFSNISPEKAAERTRRHAASGVETIWLDARHKGNLDELPRVRLQYREDASTVIVWALAGRRLSPYRLPLARFIQATCLGNLVRNEQGYWASPHDLAALERAEREDARRRAEVQRLAEARADFARKYTVEEQGSQDAEWEQGRARREAEEARDARERGAQREQETIERARADRERAEQEARERAERAQADRERAEQEARERAERDRAMRSDPVPRPPLRALGDWQADPSLLSDVELANLLRSYSRAERPAPEWVEAMERVQAEIEQRRRAEVIM